MRFSFTQEQRLFQASVRDMLAVACSPAQVRQAAEDEAGRSSELWAKLAELGVLGLLLPEAHGGLDLNELDLVLPLEETGRALLPAAIVEAEAAGALLAESGKAELAARWLPALAEGQAVLTLGLASEAAGLVADAHVADLLIVERQGQVHGVTQEQVTLLPQPSIDGTRRLFRVDWTPTTETLLARGAPASALVAKAFNRCAFGAAAQLLGVAQQMIDLAAAYAREREQFGRPVGSFHAVKHLLANALLKLEFARPPVYRAAHSLATNAATQDRDVSLAKALASEAAQTVARAALQVHGAIGYTWEIDLQLWMKRAWALAGAWGGPDWHKQRLEKEILRT